MTSDERPFRRELDRASLLRALTSAEAQVLASAGMGFLVWTDVISVKIPLYFLNEAALIVKEAISFVVTEAAHIMPDIFDGLENNKFSIADAVHVVAIAVVIYLGFMFFKRTLRGLRKISPFHWDIWPRLGWRRKLFLMAVLAAGVFAAWQLNAFPRIGSQFLVLGNQIASQLSFHNLSYVSEWLWQGIVEVYENKGTVLPIVKAALASAATYATLEVTRIAAHFLSPVIRLSYAVVSRAYPWLAEVNLSRCQKNWVHGAASVAGGLIVGYSNLSSPPVPIWAWTALVPGLFFFAKQRPNLISAVSKAGRKLGRYCHTTAVLTLARPKLVGGLTAGFIVGIAAAGALWASDPFLGFAIVSTVIKVAYVGAAIALLIAAGRGWIALVAYTGRAVGLLSMRAGEWTRDMPFAATKVARPILRLGRTALTLTSRSKAETIKPE
jgi:hypothetical protein